MSGSKPGDYDCSLDPLVTYQGQPAAYMKAKPDAELAGFGTMSQYFSAGQYCRQTEVRFSANIKAQGIDPRPGGRIPGRAFGCESTTTRAAAASPTRH